jgi:hypothetical protein
MRTLAGRVSDAEAERDALIREDAKSLVEMVKGGFRNALGSIGGRTEALDAKIGASRIKAQIASAAIAQLEEDVARLTAALENLKARKPSLIKAVITESAAGLREDYQTTVDSLREHLTRLVALARMMEPERADWAPVSRGAIEVPSFTWSDRPAQTLVVIAEREVRKSADVFGRFATALERDPLAPMPEFEPVDSSPDEGTIYHELSAPERRETDRRHAGL